MNIGIVGLGLIGGSLARAFKKYSNNRIYAHDLNSEALDLSISEGVTDGKLEEQIGNCEIIILALYPDASVEFAKDNLHRFAKGTIICDCGGTKRDVCKRIGGLFQGMDIFFCGAHPMAGIEKFGYSASFADLFLGASLIFTPSEELPRNITDKLWAEFSKLGFKKKVETTPEKHDRIIAYTSQLAHVVSSAYIMSETSREHSGFSAGSFKDLTRVAMLNEIMWTELFLENNDYLSKELDSLIERLSEFSRLIRSKDETNLRKLLKKGRIMKTNSDEENRKC